MNIQNYLILPAMSIYTYLLFTSEDIMKIFLMMIMVLLFVYQRWYDEKSI